MNAAALSKRFVSLNKTKVNSSIIWMQLWRQLPKLLNDIRCTHESDNVIY